MTSIKLPGTDVPSTVFLGTEINVVKALRLFIFKPLIILFLFLKRYNGLFTLINYRSRGPDPEIYESAPSLVSAAKLIVICVTGFKR